MKNRTTKAGPVTDHIRADGYVHVAFLIHSGVPDVRALTPGIAILRPVRGVAYYAPKATAGFTCNALRLWGPAVRRGHVLGKRTLMTEYINCDDEPRLDWMAALVDRHRPAGAVCAANTPHPTKSDSVSWCTLNARHSSPLHIDCEGLVFTDEDAAQDRPSWKPHHAPGTLPITTDHVDQDIQAPGAAQTSIESEVA